MLYKIKPLEWKYKNTSKIYTDVEKVWTAITNLSYFTIQKYKNDSELLIKSVFNDYDYTYYNANSLKEAKELCGKIWAKKLKKCLIEKE